MLKIEISFVDGADLILDKSFLRCKEKKKKNIYIYIYIYIYFYVLD